MTEPGMSAPESPELRALVDDVIAVAQRRIDARPRTEAAATRARQLAEHLRSHIAIRARSLDAPLVVLLVGPTGAGKSTIFNTIVGHEASATGVLRPTTRTAVVLVHPTDRRALEDGALATVESDRLRFVEDDAIEPGLALVDSPDVDSLEHANRDLADHLVEAADLCCFVTTATRYADRVPWAVLERVRERGLPLVVIVNRLPPDAVDQATVLADVRHLLEEAGFPPPGGREVGSPADLIAIAEGALADDPGRLRSSTIVALTDEIARLRGDREARLALARQALLGALGGLAPTLDRVADDAEHEAIDIEALRRTAERTYEAALGTLRQELGQGRFLREEALRHWQAFVGADQMTRFFAEGIGRIRGAIAAVFRPATAPVAEVRAATTDDLLAVARLQAADAARRVAAAWADDVALGQAVATDASLWLPSSDFDTRLRRRLDDWIESIGAEIQAHGRSKRALARGASVGVNALGTGVMLATFLHTGGLTGAEVGVAAATAFLNQKLLSALFGEAAMVELVAGARQRLQAALTTTFEEEAHRFVALLPPAGELPAIATGLREAATRVRAVASPG